MARPSGTLRHLLHRVWSEVWRVLVAALVGIVLLGFTITEAENGGWLEGSEPLFFVDALVGLASLGLLLLRRRLPLTIAMVLALTGLVSTSAVGASSIAIISLATHRRWRPLVLVSVPWLLSGITYEVWVNPGPDLDVPLTIGFTLLMYALCVAVGYYIGTRRELLQRLRERAETAELQQSMRVAQARIAERNRIAREMHDVLAHRISLIAMHSGALAYRTDLEPAQVTEAAGVIRDTSHQALEELRTVLGVLRDSTLSQDPSEARPREPEPPQPTLVDLASLVADAETVGACVDLHTTLDVPGVPVTLSRNAFRIIQEALTNARKHAPGEVVRLSLSGAPGEGLRIGARNGIPALVPGRPAPPPGAGLGLAGATERATLAGGRLEAGVDRAGDFVLEAWLPWPT